MDSVDTKQIGPAPGVAARTAAGPAGADDRGLRRCEAREEAADIERRILALSQGIDALKDDALSLFVAHRHKGALGARLAHLIQGLDEAWQGCRLEGVAAEASAAQDLKTSARQER